MLNEQLIIITNIVLSDIFNILFKYKALVCKYFYNLFHNLQMQLRKINKFTNTIIYFELQLDMYIIKQIYFINFLKMYINGQLNVRYKQLNIKYKILNLWLTIVYYNVQNKHTNTASSSGFQIINNLEKYLIFKQAFIHT